MEKKIPTFKSDRAAVAFVDKADLSRYDLSGSKLVGFEIRGKDKFITQADLEAGRLDEAIRRALDDEQNGRVRPL